ncbi:MAG: ABC transporter ATP-binding protein [Dehalococcoidales bacterium]|nr:ABC transporter ATP-binding protein [Dehalococcoidales bacterium]
MVSENTFQPRSDIKDLEIHNITKRFGTLVVLNNLSLDIYKGELCCLLGSSGCGKTTLLKIINGLIEPDEGNIILSGVDITRTACQKRGLGMVFQNYALFPHMNVFDNVAYGLRRRRVSKEKISQKIDQVLSLVRLSGYETRRTHELSGGQQQRVALARALVIEPRVLLLDEPLSNLDARLRGDMRMEIHRIQSQLGITTIYVTHDQEEAMSIADRIVVMNNGVIEQIGTPKDIYENPSTEFVAEFIGSINFIPGEIRGNELKLLGSTYSFADNTNIEPGMKTCAVRPERITIVPDKDTGIRGIINNVSYFGSTIRYGLTVTLESSQQEINIQVPIVNRLYDVGEEVAIFIEFNGIRFFPIDN